MEYPVSDSNSFSCRRFVRWFSELKLELPHALESSSVIGGELVFESKEAFCEGKFALRSEGAIIFCVAIGGSNDWYKNFSFGDRIELNVAKGAVTSLEPQIRIEGSFTMRLLVRPLREAKPFKFDFTHAKNWQTFIRAVREFFYDQDFLETLTPSLVTNPGMEPELEPLATEFKSGRLKKKLFLPTSPELHLKQILAAGFTEIFEIKSCFRNEEVTEHHQPEFQMLEWYRAYATLSAIEKDLVGLVKKVSNSGDVRVDRLSIAELFQLYLQFELTPQTTREDLVILSRKNAIEVTEDDSWNDVFHRLFVAKIEARLGEKNPLLVYNFPPSQAALARLTPDGWADRFELYWNGLEIANAFHELNDPVEQLKRFKADQKRREERGKTHLEIDQNFMRALESGLPPSAGIALGLDRLFMAVYGIRDIRSARFFSVEHQANNDVSD